jgi:hypothetical protein
MRHLADAPSPWAYERFGAVAGHVRRRVPEALATAVSHAIGAQAAAHITTNHAFGSARWPAQYVELVNHLQDLPDARPVRQPRTFYELVVVSGNLLLPWCYGDRVMALESRHVRPLGRLALDLLTRFGPEPRWHQQTLPLPEPTDPDDERDVQRVATALDELDPSPRVVVIAYACNAGAGLLDAQWGEAALTHERDLDWRHREPLPIPRGRVPAPRDGD